jgi:hypothetical protein
MLVAAPRLLVIAVQQAVYLNKLTKFGSSTIVQTFVNIERVDDLGFADGMLEGRLLDLKQSEDGQSVFGDLKFALRKCVAHFQISVS